MARALLIDGDEFAFRAITACTVGFKDLSDPSDPIWLPYCQENEATDHALMAIDRIKADLDADKVILTFTDKANFRMGVCPTYKGNRVKGQVPLVRILGLEAVKENMTLEHGADNTFVREGLEADDCMGILATWDKFLPDHEKIIVSIDKDMKTIPSMLYRTGTKELLTVTPEEADIWFMAQTIAGDGVDGFSGCQGVGIKTALKYLEAMEKPETFEHVLTRGPRKGEVELRTQSVPAENLWDIVKAVYETHGLCEDVALMNARLARILQASDYDFKTKQPILWSPNK